MSSKEFRARFVIDAEIQEAQAKLEALSNGILNLWGKNQVPKGLLNSVEMVREKLLSLQEYSKNGLLDKEGLASAAKDFKNIRKEIHDLQINFKLLSDEQKKGFLDPKTLNIFKGYEKEMAKYNKKIEEANELEKERLELINKRKNAKASLTRLEKKTQKEPSKNALDVQRYDELSAKQKFSEDSIAKLRSQGKNEQSVKGNELTRALEEKARIEKEIADLGLDEAKIKAGRAELLELANAAQAAKDKKEKLTAQIETYNHKIEEMKQSKGSDALEELKKSLGDLGMTGLESADSIEVVKAKFKEFSTGALRGVDAEIEGVTSSLQEMDSSLDGIQRGVETSTEAFKAHDKVVADQAAFNSRVQQFIGLRGAAELMRRALRNAFETIKVLDSAITEMAVVTDKDISDYWGELPDYTQRANEMGLAIKDVYQADTLFYQQGLKTNEVVALSTQTMKMARIAGLDTAEATDRMTAALRGFNMELNETNAQKIADVYSELAAITASDVDEISSAMTKTASIAASAGMEFETTAAFLSQIIETTRESAETAGTAMKTVIARFQELKKDPSEIGEVDGEIIDANKIETALRSVGVALRDSSGQFRDLDDVFLELAQKWDGLDTNTQRYIATIAAGSRQQSRFIAMMSDYGRTQELVSAANGSAGASNEQFGKTMESMSAKLNQLKNAWDSFTMGFLDSEAIKFIIELLTKFISILDKASQGLGGLGDTLLKIGMVFAVFKTGEAIYNKFILGLVDKFRSAGAEAGKAFAAELKTAVEAEQNPLNPNPNPSSAESSKSTKMGAWKTFAAARQASANADNLITQGTTDKTAALDTINNIKTQQAANPPIAKIEQEFKTKMKNISNSQELADKTWNKYVKDIQKGGDKAEDAINELQRELKETAEMRDLIDAEDEEMEGLGFADSQEAVSLETGKEMIQQQQDLTAATEQLTQAEATLAQGQQAQAEAAKLAQQANEKFGQTMQNVGMIAMGVSAGLAAISTELEEEGAEEAAKAFEVLSTVLSVLGTTAMALPTVLKVLGISFNGAGFQAMAGGLAAQLGWWPLVAILAAVAAVIAIVVAAFVAAQKNSPEAKLKAAQEAAEGAAEAAEMAAEAFEHLSESFDDLSDKYKDLDKLTKGTKEWRAAVREINKEVSELVTQYPELSKLVKSDNGVLTIDLDSQEAQDILMKYENISLKADSAAVAAQMHADDVALKNQTQEVKGKITQSKLLTQEDVKHLTPEMIEMIAKNSGGQFQVMEDAQTGETKLGKQGYSSSGVQTTIEVTDVQEILDAMQTWANEGDGGNELIDTRLSNFSEAYAQGWIYETSEGWKIANEEMVESLGLTEEIINQFGSSLGDQAEDIKAFGEAIVLDKDKDRARMEQLAMNAVQMVDYSGIVSDDERDQVAGAASAEYINALTDEAIAQYEQKLEGIDEKKGQEKEDSKKEVYEEMARELYGTGTKVEYKNGRIYVGEGDSAQDFSEEEFKTMAVEGYKTEIAAENLEKVPDAINKLSSSLEKTAGEAFEQLYLESEGAELTKEQLEALEKEDLEKAWNLLDDTQKAALGGFDVFKQKVEESIAIQKGAFDDVAKSLEQKGLEMETINAHLTSNAMKGLAGKLNALVSSSGVEAGEQFISNFNQVTEGMSDSEVDQFVGMITAIDWKDADAWDSLATRMNEMKFATHMTDEEIQSFIESAKECAEAISKIDLSKLLETVRGTNTILDNITSGEQNRNFSDEDYEKIIALDPSLMNDFVMTEEGYEYIGSSMEKLAEVIEANTDAQAKAGIEQLQAKIEAGKIGNALTGKGSTATIVDSDTLNQYSVNTRDAEKWNEDVMRDYVATILNSYQDAEVDINKLGLSYLGNGSSIESIKKMSKEELQQTIQEVLAINNEQNQNELSFTQTENNTRMMSLLNNTLAENIDLRQTGADDLAQTAVATQARKLGIDESMIQEYYEAIEKGDKRTMMRLENAFLKMQEMQEDLAEQAKDWTNPYDDLYNKVAQINTVLRERERLERAYEEAVWSTTASANDYLEIQKKQMANLVAENELIKEQLALSKQELQNTWSEGRAEWQDLVTVGQNGQITIDYEGYENADWANNPELRSAFEEWVSTLEDNADAIFENKDSLDANTKAQRDQIKQARDQTSDLYNQVRDALLGERQREIDALKDINDSINEANTDILDSMREQIDEQRRARENEKAAGDIMDLETRLAYLRMDTTGGNALEIAELEKQLADEKQNYEDSLVDQSLDNLEAANEKAAKQRERQIEVAEQQLEEYQNSEQIWTEVKTLIDSSVDQMNNGIPAVDTAVGKLLREDNKLNNPNPFETEQWKTDLNETLAAVKFYQDATKGLIDTNADDIDSLEGSLAGLKFEIDQLKSGNEEDDVKQEGPHKTTNGAPIIQRVGISLPYDRLANQSVEVEFRAYKSGGLADYTGPAWLDGTKARPELVLNQQDTQNFIALKDILSDVMKNASRISQQKEAGDNYFDIEIKVDSIENDYDVDQLADRIRELIYQDATYRNVNVVNQKY